MILLPGLDQQMKFLLANLKLSGMKICVVGTNSEKIAERFSKETDEKIGLIVQDYESLMNSKLILSGNENVNVSLMSYESTDFNDAEFDLVYAQASISLTNRNKIVKELKRILKPGGYFCVGEVVALENPVPRFVTDLWDNSDLKPLFTDEIKKYYEERKFKIMHEKNLNKTLAEFYSDISDLYQDQKHQISEQEKSYYKKLLNKINHEINVYLKLGGDKYIGFKSLIMQKV